MTADNRIQVINEKLIIVLYKQMKVIRPKISLAYHLSVVSHTALNITVFNVITRACNEKYFNSLIWMVQKELNSMKTDFEN